MTYLKWVGNKQKLLALLRPLFPVTFNSYYEPFLGSGAVFFYIACDDEDLETQRSYWLSDKNEWLMNCHHCVAHHYRSVKRELAVYEEQEQDDPKAFFNSLRELTSKPVNQEDTGVKEASIFLYLNRRAYGGMWRTNKSGLFNVPFDPSQKTGLISKNLGKCSALLRKAELRCGEYDEISPAKNDFVFLDPPYYPLSATSSFTGYTAEGWREADHENLMNFLKELDSKGVRFLMTNNDCDFVKTHCKGFNQRSEKVKRYIDAMTHHSKKGSTSKSKREPVSEYFVWNYEERG